jgi:hypothetical protein
VDAEEARAFLRQMTDEFIELVGQVNQARRNDAAVRAVDRVHGAGFALMAAAGLPHEAMDEARLAAVEALADLGYLDRAQANWLGARIGSRLAVLPERNRQVERPATPVAGPGLVRVVPVGVQVGPDQAGAMVLVASLEVYDDRLVGRYARLGGDPGSDDLSWSPWLARDDTGLELGNASRGAEGALPFEVGTVVWMPAPADQARSLLVTVQTASGPELVTLPLGA